MAVTSNPPITQNTLTDLDTLAWLTDQGAAFCRVKAWNSTGKNPGKAPYEEGWQDNPLTLDQALEHLAGGGNVGMIAGHHSGGLCLLDADKWLSEFLDLLPGLGTGPRITRGKAPDKAKILIRVIGELPEPRKLYRPGEKHPFFEFLATGNQGVTAGTHPEQVPYTLELNNGIVQTCKARDIEFYLATWNEAKGGRTIGGQPLTVAPKRTQPTAAEGDHLKEQVLDRWPTLEVFEHFGFAGDPAPEGGELRLKGNGGLLIRLEGGAVTDTWGMPALGKGCGGGPFEAWQFCETGSTKVPTGRGFFDLLCRMAEAGGVAIPERSNGHQPPVPEFDNWQPTDDQAPGEELPAATTAPAAAPGQQAAALRKTRYTAQELAEAEFPEPQWAVPGLIPVGFTFLAGRPKVGKSWLALQIAHAVGTGGRVFDIPIQKGNVFYLALEDNPSRLKERSIKQGLPLREAAITFETRFKNLGEGGLNELVAELTVTDYSLIVIDTLSRFLGSADQMDAAKMTNLLGPLQTLALQRGIAILVVDHHRKGNAGMGDDPIDDLWNSTAKAAIADNAIGLYRERGNRGEALLKVRGREVEAKDLALKWDREFCIWQCLGDADQVREDTNKGQVYQALITLVKDNEIPTNDKVATFTELDRGNVSRILGQLADENRVIRGMKNGREVPYWPVVNGTPLKVEL